jgi:hypothetical protein
MNGWKLRIIHDGGSDPNPWTVDAYLPDRGERYPLLNPANYSDWSMDLPTFAAAQEMVSVILAILSDAWYVSEIPSNLASMAGVLIREMKERGVL